MAGYIGANTSSVTNNQNAAERRKKFTFTANTNVLSGLNFAHQKIHIFHNGIRLVRTTDYTEAADGKSVTLVNAAQAGDEVVAVTFAQDPASNAGYTDADVDAHLLTAGVTLDATNDRIGVGIAAPTAPIHIEAPDNTELMNFTVTGNEKWALKGASGVGSDDYVSFGISGGTEAIRWHEAGHVVKPNQVGFFATTSSHVTSSGDIVFDTVTFNRGSHYNNSNGRFTAPINGVYFFSFACLLYNMGYNSSATLRVNGSNYGSMSSFGTYGQFTGSYAGQGASAVAELNANDYVTINFIDNGTELHNYYTWWSGFHIA